MRALLFSVVAAAICIASVAQAAPPAPAPPASKSSSKTQAPGKNGTKPAPATPKTTRSQDSNVRRQVAGGPTLDDTSVGADTPELRALHAAERELFPPASPFLGTPWPSDVPFPVATTR